MKTELVVGDFETYWSDTHSLSKMSALEYVMSPKTELISLALKKEGKSVCVFGEQNIRELVGRIDWSNKLLVAHNNSEFDALIFAFRLGVKPKMWGCTLAMARPIHAKSAGGSLAALVEHYGIGKKDASALVATKGKHLKDFTPEEIAAMRAYNTMDAEQCYELFYKLLPQTPKAEMQIIDATIRMLVEPQFVLDEPLLTKTLTLEQDHKRDMLISLAVKLGAGSIEEVRKTLASAPKFAAFLTANDVPVPMKPNPKGKMIPALAKTDEGFIALTEHENELVAAAANTRLGVKSTQLETRIVKFLDAAKHCSGRIPVPIKYYGADTTGRWSGFWYNLQNLPRIMSSAPKLSDALRYSLLAPPGYKVVVADLSGIELRVNLTLWKVPYAMDLLAADPEADLYKPLASEVLGVPIEDMPKMVRQAGKAMHLGCFAPDTKVVTNHGIKPIIRVLATDMVWDGETWTTHGGLIPQGLKEVKTQYGVTATLDHEILTEHGWADWSAVCENRHLFQSAIRRGSWLSSRGDAGPIHAKPGIIRGLGVLAGGKALLTAITSRSVRLLDAISALSKPRGGGSNSIGSTQTLFQMTRTVRDFLTDCLPPLAGATGGQTKMERTNFGVLRCVKSGATTGQSFCGTWSRSPDGTSPSTTWIESTTIGGTNRGIFGSLAAGITATINALSHAYRQKSAHSKQRSPVYDLANCGLRNRFTVITDHGPILVHNCGFGLGSEEKYITVAKTMAQIVVSPEDAARHIAGYRNKHPEVVQGWRICHRALDYIYSGNEAQIDPWGLCRTSREGIVTPKGVIRYPDLRKEVNEESSNVEWVYGTGRRKARIYAGKVTENCVSKGTLVLTDKGWKPIERVYLTDLVHDGESFVRHGGKIYKSVQECVTVDGVYMTPDHEVLTNDGWKEASQVSRPYRPSVRSTDRLESVAHERKAVVLDVPVQLREAHGKTGPGRDEGSKAWRDAELWLSDNAAYFRRESQTWNDKAPSVRGLSKHDRSVPSSITQGMEKLRRAWNNGLRTVEGFVREFLGRYGGVVPAGHGFGPTGQQRTVFFGKLPVGATPGEHYEQANHAARGHTNTGEGDRGIKVHTVLQTGEESAAGRSGGQTKSYPVFDIVNCGPQHRFVVLGENGPFIVHNCVQHLARNVLADNMIEVRRQTGRWPVHTVHDELIYIVPENEAEAQLDMVQAVMRTPPVWWPELVTWSEGSIGNNYGEAK